MCEKKGLLIAIEGLDGSGKETQTTRLEMTLTQEGVLTRKVSFPTYTKSSALIEMYLGGEFGEDPASVNAYAASAFFAVDRFASWRTGWGDSYEDGAVILCDRYTTANLIHQMVKLPKEEWPAFIDWLEDFEHNKLGIPRPDKIIYLTMPVDFSAELVRKRHLEQNGSMDIHEKNIAYLRACHEAANFACERCGWTRVQCVENGALRSIASIGDEVRAAVADLLPPLE